MAEDKAAVNPVVAEQAQQEDQLPCKPMQLAALMALGKSLRLTSKQLGERAQRDYGKLPAELTREEAGAFIKALRGDVEAQQGRRR